MKRYAKAIAIIFLILIAVSPNLPGQNYVKGSQPDDLRPGTDVYALFSLPRDERVWPALDSLGVGWIRLQYQMGETDANQSQQAFLRVLNEGYGLWLTIYHRDRTNVADTLRFDASSRGSFPAADSTAYANLLTSTIQPLADDLAAQGKNPAEWLVIQYANEVSPEDVLPPSPTRFFHGTQDQYLTELSRTYDVVKSISDDIPVAFGAISSKSLEAILNYNRTGNDSLKSIVDWNEKLLAEGRYDWGDIHLYHAVESISEKVAWVRERWQGPLAASEVGGPDERTGVEYSEALQAEELPSRIRTTLESGVNRVFWSFLVDLDLPDDRLAQTLGLIASDWRHKSAYFVYRDLIADAVTSVEIPTVPVDFVLKQNFPNPFNPETVIEYQLSTTGEVELAIYDVVGRHVRTLRQERQNAGTHNAIWDGRDNRGRAVASGIYLYRLVFGNQIEVRRMVLLR